MRLTGSGIVFDTRTAPANERSASATHMLRASDGTLFVTVRLGTVREGPDGHTAILVSDDDGESWQMRYLGLGDRDWDGMRGETRGWMLAELEPGVLTATVVYVDRSTGDAWINPQTQGILPMHVYHLDSRDGGWTWTDRRRFDLAPWPGASPTGPLLRLGDGALAQPFEHWKSYDDASPASPSAQLRISVDGGRTWPRDVVVGRHPDDALYYWDQRIASHPESGALVSMMWTHDPVAGRDRDVHISFAAPDGGSWSEPAGSGLAGQHCCPIPLGGDRLLAVYTHRGSPPGIRACLSEDFGRTWDLEDELEVWSSEAGLDAGVGSSRSADEYWSDMGAWQFGHPFGARISATEVVVAFYGGVGDARPARWARIEIEPA